MLRHGDPLAERLDVAETAPALVICERGSDAAGVSIEHELIVLAAFANRALPRQGQRHIRGLESA